MSELSQSVQDYLKAIYNLTRGKVPTTTSALAERLGFAPASVTNMIQKLAGMQPPMVVYHKRQSVELTEEGEKAALRILRRHRLLETFMVNILGFTWDEVHDEADHLEHIISARFEERLARFLENPKFDPHGDPIPGQDLVIPPSNLSSLAVIQTQQGGRVRRVLTNSPEVLRYFDEIGIRPGEEIVVNARDPFDTVFTVKIGDSKNEYSIGSKLAGLIEVEMDID